ncbi:cupin domain-containing protein [Aspergillus lucknowensis]|uniref:Cupin 2 conserved barrel domain-containing protein n=1 Tax=Aspergillus lucknowensis TaxID=176173 RepID=A0ABR4M4Z6_9EURO
MSSSYVPVSDIKVVKSGDTYAVEGRPRETFEILKVFHPSNLPGKQIVVGRVFVPPNGASPPHTHGGASIVAVATDGAVLNQMNNQEPSISKRGEFWYEAPGCHHQRSENNTQENAEFIAVLVVDDETVKDGYHSIFVLDAEKEQS